MKNVLYFLAGAAVGTGVTYALLRKYYNETIIPEIREDYKERLEYEVNAAKEHQEYDDQAETYQTETEDDEEVKTTKKKSVALKSSRDKEDKGFDYSACSKSSNVKVDTEAADKSMDETKQKNNKIYCISEDDFIELNGCEKVTLTYFAGDDVFMNEYEQPEINGLKLIGRAQLKEIKNYEGNAIYVHNTHTDTDYEVIYEEGSYADYIEGN